jgi:predicted house-cleaning noncanonical NTP pyrophosphatase (MazG superfamily)
MKTEEEIFRENKKIFDSLVRSVINYLDVFEKAGRAMDDEELRKKIGISSLDEIASFSETKAVEKYEELLEVGFDLLAPENDKFWTLRAKEIAKRFLMEVCWYRTQIEFSV